MCNESQKNTFNARCEPPDGLFPAVETKTHSLVVQRPQPTITAIPAEASAQESPQIIQAQKSQPSHASNFHKSMQIGRTQNGIEVIAIDRPIEQVVSFSGSLVAGDRSSPPDAPLLASLTAAMLDQGTQKQDRFQIAETLDRLGAQIQFSADSHHVRFSGRFLRQRSGSVINLLAEQIRQPAFSPAVFKNLKQRKKPASCKRCITRTI